jgi:hypothetical protein
MRKRMGLFLMAVALAATALATQPVVAQRLLCGQHLACFVGPVCCADSGCAEYCNNLNPGGGSVPHCSGTFPEGGCCDCDVLEVEQ